MSKNTGGPAFPCLERLDSPSHEYRAYSEGGMTLRDYFAAQALPALIKIAFTQNVRSKSGDCLTEEVMAEQAYHFADAMIAARGAA